MSKKKIAILISAVVVITAAVTAMIIFRSQIADFFESVKTRFQRPAAKPEPPFTDEEREAFADI